MLQNLLVAAAFVLASAWVTWALVLPRRIKTQIRKVLGLAAPPAPAKAGGSCGGCCGGCGSEGVKPPAG